MLFPGLTPIDLNKSCALYFSIVNTTDLMEAQMICDRIVKMEFPNSETNKVLSCEDRTVTIIYPKIILESPKQAENIAWLFEYESLHQFGEAAFHMYQKGATISNRIQQGLKPNVAYKMRSYESPSKGRGDFHNILKPEDAVKVYVKGKEVPFTKAYVEVDLKGNEDIPYKFEEYNGAIFGVPESAKFDKNTISGTVNGSDFVVRFKFYEYEF